MILVRNIFQAKYGQGDALVQAFKASQQVAMAGSGGGRRGRILTDLSGPFFTVVLEIEAESLGEWESTRAKMFSDPAFGEQMQRSSQHIESGRVEYYTIEAET